MPSNVEIKAKIRNIDDLKHRARELSGEEESVMEFLGTLIEQEDTFFNVPNGRLKLRCLKDKPSQLIYYERSDSTGPKLSNFYIAPTDKPQELLLILQKALGIKGVVKKQRNLYMVGQTRVHVDHVDNLGDFMELEVVLEEGQTTEYGQNIAEDLMDKLGILKDDLLSGAYMDLILAKQS